jgi:hypothetical protein
MWLALAKILAKFLLAAELLRRERQRRDDAKR